MTVCFRSFSELSKAKHASEEIDEATEQLQKQLKIEKALKIQAVNKLAEIVNRKDFVRENSKKRKAPSDDLRKKEKENRKLHQELGAVSGWQGWRCGDCTRLSPVWPRFDSRTTHKTASYFVQINGRSHK